MFFEDYRNLSAAIIPPLETYIRRNLASSDDWVERQIYTRGAYFLLLPTDLITSATDVALGIFAGIGSICTGGTKEGVWVFTFRHLQSSRYILSRAYLHALFAVNPNAKFAKGSARGDGLVSGYVTTILKDIAIDFRRSKDSILRKQVASRLTYALIAISCVVTRAVDGVIGILAVPISIVTGGKYMMINIAAYRALQATGIVYDLWYCAAKIINPRAGIFA